MDSRKCILDLLTAALEQWPAFAQLENRAAIIRRIERGCYNATVSTCERDGIPCFWTERRFVERYSAECSRILAHVDTAEEVTEDTLPPHLVALIASGAVKPSEVAAMSTIEMCPEATATERAEIDRRRGVKLEVKVSRAHRCKCGANETTVLEYAGRSADEAMMLSIRCVVCGHTWRKG